MIENAINALLTNDAGVGALVNDRIAPNEALQGWASYIVYKQISGQDTLTHSGPSNPSRARFQFDCVAKKYLDAKAIAKAVRTLMHGARWVADGTTIQYCSNEGQQDVPFFDAGNEANRLRGVSLDFIIDYTG